VSLTSEGDDGHTRTANEGVPGSDESGLVKTRLPVQQWREDLRPIRGCARFILIWHPGWGLVHCCEWLETNLAISHCIGSEVSLVADHVADPIQAVPGARGNYLLYLRTMRRAFIGAAVSTACFTPRVVLGIVEGFQTSPAEGWSSVATLAYVLGGAALLIVAVMLACWLPALIRIAILTRQLPDATFYLVRSIPNFWDRLSLVDPTHGIGRRIPNATVSLDSTGVTVWRGVWRPRIIAKLPMHQLVSVETDRSTGIPFKRRIMILTFRLGLVVEELPIAFRRVAGFGLTRLSATSERRVAERLRSMS
jgi:hypothetical protein